MKKTTMTSGEIAKLCGINKKTLFYYDEIGLLKPAAVASNGYRSYTIAQADRISQIKALQSVGMSLEEIERQLETKDLAHGLQTLREQQQKIERKAEELLRVQSALSLKIGELEQFEKQGADHVFTAWHGAQWLKVDEVSIGDGLITNYLSDGYDFGIMLDGPSSSTTVKKYLQTPKESANFEKPEGLYASIHFIANEKELMDDARNALAILNESGKTLAGPAFLKDVAGDFISFGNGQAAFLLSIRVENE
ncbi:MerR family transcriptional regulator [Planococcus plakortidis]